MRWKCHKSGCLDVWSLHVDCLISLWMFDLSNRVLFHLGWVIALQSRIDGFQPKVHICASKYQRGEIWGKYEPSSNESVVLNSEPFQAFKLFDKDGDGLVTLSELMSLIKKVRMKVKTLECSIKGPPALEKLLSDRPALGGREHAWAGGKSSARGGGPGGFSQLTVTATDPVLVDFFKEQNWDVTKKYCVGNSQDGNQGVDYQEFTRLWSMIRAPIEVLREKQVKYKERSQCC